MKLLRKAQHGILTQKQKMDSQTKDNSETKQSKVTIAKESEAKTKQINESMVNISGTETE